MPNGIRELAKCLYKERMSRIAKEIRRLKTLSSSGKKIPDPNRINSSVQLYEQCLDERFRPNVLKSSSEFPGASTLGDGYITFSMAGCSSQADADLDELGDFNNKLGAEELRPYLSAYGKYIFLGEADGSITVKNPYGQIFCGKINGNIPVTLYLGPADPTPNARPFAEAKYYYDRYRKIINLSAVRQDDSFLLTETDSKETTKPVLSFKVKGQELVGQWRGGGRVYSFVAAP